MEIRTLEGVNSKEIREVFNHSFSDYFIPLKLTKDQFALKLLADKIDLSLSVGVFDGPNLIAFILHGFDTVKNQKVIYNGGTGVIPEKRGFGLTKKMHQFILPLLIDNEISHLTLEVISENIQAIKSYKTSGYIIQRELVCYKGNIQCLKTNESLKITELLDYNWTLMESFWEVSPTWQNSNRVINDQKHTIISLGAYLQNQLIGYVIYNVTNKRIQQLAVSQLFRREKVASTLISELIKRYGNSFTMINVDKRSNSMNAFMVKIGFENILEQLEMKLDFEKQPS